MSDSVSTPDQRGHSRWRRIRGALLAAFLVLVLPVAVYGFGSIGSTWQGLYPASSSYTNASCQLCHGPSTSTWNAYGLAILNGGANAAAITAAEGANSDGDPGGATNLAEINANSQPGWTIGSVNTIYNADGSVNATNQPPPAGITGLIDPAVSPSPSPAVSPSPSPAVSPSPSPAVSPSPSPTPAGPFIDVEDDTLLAGQTVVVFGQGYRGGTNVQLWLDPAFVLLKTVVAAADGSFSATVQIPPATSVGAHSIVSVGLDPSNATLELQVAITVSMATPPPTATVDPIVSADIPSLAQVLALLVAIAGAACLSVTHIRRRQRR